MKKNALIIVVAMLICVTIVSLSGCFLFAKPFDTLAKYVQKNGEELEGQYCYTYEGEEGDVVKVIYNPESADQIQLQFIDPEFQGETFSINLTKEQGNYTWTFSDAEYGEATGHYDLTKPYTNDDFVVIEDLGESEFNEEYITLSAKISLLSFDLFLLDKDFSFTAEDFGFTLNY